MRVYVPSIGQRVPAYLPIASPATVTMYRRPPTRKSISHSATVVLSGPHHSRRDSAWGPCAPDGIHGCGIGALEMQLSLLAEQLHAHEWPCSISFVFRKRPSESSRASQRRSNESTQWAIWSNGSARRR